MATAWNVAGRLALLMATGLGFALVNQRDPLASGLWPLYVLTIALVVGGIAMAKRGKHESG